MKLHYVFIICLLIGCSSKQQKDEHPKFTVSKDFYSSFFNSDSTNVYSLCARGVILFYFQVDDKGQIRNIEYSKKANDVLASRFVKHLTSFNGEFISDGDSEKVYLLPYIYNLQTGCTAQQKTENLSDLFLEQFQNVVVMRPIRETTIE